MRAGSLAEPPPSWSARDEGPEAKRETQLPKVIRRFFDPRLTALVASLGAAGAAQTLLSWLGRTSAGRGGRLLQRGRLVLTSHLLALDGVEDFGFVVVCWRGEDLISDALSKGKRRKSSPCFAASWDCERRLKAASAAASVEVERKGYQLLFTPTARPINQEVQLTPRIGRGGRRASLRSRYSTTSRRHRLHLLSVDLLRLGDLSPPLMLFLPHLGLLARQVGRPLLLELDLAALTGGVLGLAAVPLAFC